MRSRHVSWIPVCLTLVLTGVAPGAQAADAAAEEVQKLRTELTALRTQMAQTQLELHAALLELKELRAVAQSPDATAEADKWRAEREQLAAERRKLAIERRRLEQARLTLAAASRGAAGPTAGARPQANGGGAPNPIPPAAASGDAAAPNGGSEAPFWDLQYKLGVIRNNAPTYFDTDGGDVIVPLDGGPDTQNVMVRGTLQNRSTAPWRYTFEVRLGNGRGQIIGSWRHQTQVLGPNELAAFEVKVPVVTHIGDITTYQIGNISADRPADPALAPPAASDRPAGDSEPVRERVNR